jgi:acetolactate synthase-1/2/3 large subunit
MTGAESLARTLVACGVDVCFANPGTSEMHFVAALDHVRELRAILCLFEGVATGAADGYGRMAGKPAATLLHLGPGLANGLANLHNARRAASPILNIVGDHARAHLAYDAPLTSDLRSAAALHSAWVHCSASAGEVARDAARAVQAALALPGQIATLILPADTAWKDAAEAADPLPRPTPERVATATVDALAKKLRTRAPSALLLRGTALQREGLEAAGRVAAATGARLLCDTFAPRQTRGAGLVPVERLPYFGEQIAASLEKLERLVLVGAQPPVSFFAYPGKPSWCLPPGCDLRVLAEPREDSVAALVALADALGAPREPMARASLLRPELASGRLDAAAAGRAIARCLPEGAIVVDEAATAGPSANALLGNAPEHDVLSLTGGSIGMGLPLAVGAAVACPNRKVVCLHGDGGAMYTPQALWTQAREKLDIVNVIFSNRAYAILNIELMRVGAGAGGEIARSLFDLSRPALDFVSLARGMGVEASRAENAEAFADQFSSALAGRGPRLIEAVIA